MSTGTTERPPGVWPERITSGPSYARDSSAAVAEGMDTTNGVEVRDAWAAVSKFCDTVVLQAENDEASGEWGMPVDADITETAEQLKAHVDAKVAELQAMIDAAEGKTIKAAERFQEQ